MMRIDPRHVVGAWELVAMAVVVSAACWALADQPAPAPAPVSLVKPTPEQVAWQDMELGMFIHWDIPWDHRDYDHKPKPDVFNPTKLDTDQWMQAAKAFGAKYCVLTATHGTGFMLWQSEAYPFGMKQSPYKNGTCDVVKEYVVGQLRPAGGDLDRRRAARPGAGGL
ncbi:MAG: alpha-L-fucosidase [Planctomycetota bacterium]|nr:alpha-L-fucosidase [Planctomycetota bacterium]